MKRILASLLTIAIVAAVGLVVTKAQFTDTETSTGNTFSTGTIDIAVDGQNPWSRSTPYQLTDMKPSQTDYANFTIKNVGTNPVNVWKKISVTNQTDGTVSEPECTEGSGTWTQSGNPQCGGTYVPNFNIASAINYDLAVWVYDVDPSTTGAQPIWWQVIYTDAMGKKISTLNGQDTFLGMIPKGWYMKVVQSYHMVPETTNWAQGDNMTFNITLTGEQLMGTAVLEDKTGEPDWRIKTETAAKGTLTYGVKDSKFNFSFTGKVTLLNENYSLIVYHEPWSTPTSPVVWPRPVTILGSAMSDGSGNVTIPSTSVELGVNLLNAKIWLVKTADLSGNTISGWNWADYLFDTGLIDYYDADL